VDGAVSLSEPEGVGFVCGFLVVPTEFEDQWLVVGAAGGATQEHSPSCRNGAPTVRFQRAVTSRRTAGRAAIHSERLGVRTGAG
jgi:hypothetical protein